MIIIFLRKIQKKGSAINHQVAIACQAEKIAFSPLGRGITYYFGPQR
jgi:hypothetical protein